MEHFDNVLIFSFKDQTFLTVKEFIEVFDTFFLKKVEENLFMADISSRKIFIKLNEVFVFNHDYYSLIDSKSCVSVFLIKNFSNNFFVKSNYSALAKLFIDFCLFKVIINLFLKVLKKNKNLIKMILLFVFLFGVFSDDNIIQEDLNLIKNKFLVQQKIYFGFGLLKSKAIELESNNKDNFGLKKNIGIDYSALVGSKFKNLNENYKKDMKTKKTANKDKDIKYFLNLKKGHLN